MPFGPAPPNFLGGPDRSLVPAVAATSEARLFVPVSSPLSFDLFPSDRHRRRIFRYQSLPAAPYGIEPAEHPITLVRCIQFQVFREKHGRAAGRSTIGLGESQRRSLEQKNATGSSLGFARHPKAVFVARDKKQWNRATENVGFRPLGKFANRSGRNARRPSIRALLFAFDDETRAAKKGPASVQTRSRPRHHRDRAWATRRLPGAALTGTMALCCINRRHRAISCLERRSVKSGTARFVRSTKY
jgi:hypothetical protein